MNKRFIIMVSFVLLISLLVMGCQSGTTSKTTTTAPATTASSTTKPASSTTQPVSSTTQPVASTTKPVSTTAATTAAASKTGGTLRIGSFEEIPVIGNPVTQTYSSGVLVLDTLLEGLLTLDASGTPVPWLASEWKMDVPNLKMTLNLRKNVKFSDGTIFDAQAAKWNLDRCITAKKAELASVTAVDIIDDSTIVLKLKQPDGLLTTYLAGIRGLMISPTAYQKSGATEDERSKWAEQHPVGTGPFTLQSRDRDVKTVLVKNPSYWQAGKPYLDKIVYTPFADQTTLMADFKAGNQDVFITHQVQDVQALSQDSKYVVLQGDVSTIGGLEGDSKHTNSPWSSKKVRQAAQHAVDAVSFAKTMGYGYWQATNQFDIPSRWGYNPSVVGYSYNVAKAKQLMAEAGFPNGFKTVIYGMDQYSSMLAALIAYFKEIGITATSQIVTPEKRVQMFSSTGWDGVWIWECTVQPNSLYNMGRNFTAAAAPGRMISCDVPADFSALVSKAVAETDLTKQKELTWQAQKDLVDTYAVITPFFAAYYPIVTTKKVHDLQLNTTLHYSPADWWMDK